MQLSCVFLEKKNLTYVKRTSKCNNKVVVCEILFSIPYFFLSVIQYSGQSNMQKVQCNVHKSQRKHSETAGKNSSDRLDPTQYIPWLENMTSKHYQINSLEDFYGIANFSHKVKFQQD